MEPHHRETVPRKCIRQAHHRFNTVLVDIGKQNIIHSRGNGLSDGMVTVGVKLFQVEVRMGIGEDHVAKLAEIAAEVLLL